jgi:hypothetical protein
MGGGNRKKSKGSKGSKGKKGGGKQASISPAERIALEGHVMLEDLYEVGPEFGEEAAGTVVMVLFHDPHTGAARWRMSVMVSDSVCGARGVKTPLLAASKALHEEAKRLGRGRKVPVH